MARLLWDVHDQVRSRKAKPEEAQHMPTESESFPGPSNTTLGNGNHHSISTLSLQDMGDYLES